MRMVNIKGISDFIDCINLYKYFTNTNTEDARESDFP